VGAIYKGRSEGQEDGGPVVERFGLRQSEIDRLLRGDDVGTKDVESESPEEDPLREQIAEEVCKLKVDHMRLFVSSNYPDCEVSVKDAMDADCILALVREDRTDRLDRAEYAENAARRACDEAQEQKERAEEAEARVAELEQRTQEEGRWHNETQRALAMGLGYHSERVAEIEQRRLHLQQQAMIAQQQHFPVPLAGGTLAALLGGVR